MTLPVAIFDTECARNYWLARFRNPATNNSVSFELYKGHPLNVDGLRKVLSKYTLVGFNSTNYDLPMITYALSGATNEELKELNDDIITTSKQSWQIETQYHIEIPRIDHIDLFNVAPGVMDSLKIYGGRLHTKRMQDLPFEPDEDIPPEFFQKVNEEYCANDLQQTLELYEALQPALKVRERLSAENGMDLRSKSDPQLAEAIICSQVEKMNDAPVKRPSKDKPEPFKYDPPEWVSFKTDKLKHLLTLILDSTFSVETSEGGKDSVEGLLDEAKEPIVIHGRTYQFGIGGLHSQETNTSWRSNQKATLYEIDATSFYPSSILNNGWFPPQLGEEFLTVFRTIVESRIAAKKALKEVSVRLENKRLGSKRRQELEPLKEDLTEENEGGKIKINGTFGKAGSKFSYFYSPKMMLQVTITCQLATLMLIERLELAGISVVSVNTDGLVVYCLTDQRETMNEIVAQWESETSFNMEETEYLGLFSQSVNNYFAIKSDGKIKGKGIFAETGLKHSPNNQICYKAVIDYIKDATPIEDTVKACTDIREFIAVRVVNGGALKDGGYIGKAIRYYHSTATDTPIVYRDSGNKVPETDGCSPCMTLPDSLPKDLDFNWYIEKAKGILFTPAYLNTPKKVSGIGLSISEVYALAANHKIKPFVKGTPKC